jgi:hypothetical protein
VGDKGTVLHWNGTAWSASTGGTSVVLNGVWGSRSSDVWAVGGEGKATTITHWNGRAWSVASTGLTYVPPPPGAGHMGETSMQLLGVWGSGPNDVWAVGTDRMHWDGQKWSQHWEGPGSGNDRVGGVWGSGPNDVWVVAGRWGDDGGWILHWNGGTWSEQSSGSKPLSGIWGSSPGDVWAVGAAGTILHHP